MKIPPVTDQFLYFGLLWLLVLLSAVILLGARIGDWLRSRRREASARYGSLPPSVPGAPGNGAKSELPEASAEASSGWEIILETGAAEPEQIRLASDAVNIGRSETASLKLEDEFASSIHTILRQSAGELILEDQDSTNGTFVNGMPVSKSVSLRHGDVIRIGKSQITVL